MERKIYRNFIRIPFGEIKGKLEYLCKIKISILLGKKKAILVSLIFADDFLPDINVDNVKNMTLKGKNNTWTVQIQCWNHYKCRCKCES